ncbi:MAG: SGNH/GDSL hydrolase family protein [Acidimicrobiales bacterium]
MGGFLKGRRLTTVAAMGLVVLAAACGSDASGSPPPSSTAPSPVEYYVSLGDSYAAGYQPTGANSGHTDTNGFAYQVVGLAAYKGYHFKLVNFGCGGATTTSIIDSVGCPQVLLGPGATTYPTQTQAAAAESFLRTHRGKVRLITISISGNDVTHCASVAQPIPCVVAAVTTIKKNVSNLLSRVRAAAGPGVQIVGTTYPDVILGEYLSTSAAAKNIATLSVTAFKDLINPALKKAYQAVGGDFVDVTAATGAYGSMTQTTDLAPYGVIPVPVAKVCELTYFCQYQNIHPKTAGYKVIAELVVGTLPPLTGSPTS